MVYQPSKEKSWHKYNMTNSTSNLVAPTIDTSVEEEPCRPRPQDVSKYRERKIMELSLYLLGNE